jgi:Creatinase/Prolidase N-terminal domain
MRSDNLRALIARHDAGAIVLRHVANFAWYTGGGDSRVDHANATGVADVVITSDAEYVVTSTIEALRMRTEQTPDFEVVVYPWHEGPEELLRELADGKEVLLDSDPRVRDHIAALRRVLDERARAATRRGARHVRRACIGGGSRCPRHERARGRRLDRLRAAGARAGAARVARGDRCAHPGAPACASFRAGDREARNARDLRGAARPVRQRHADPQLR